MNWLWRQTTGGLCQTPWQCLYSYQYNHKALCKGQSKSLYWHESRHLSDVLGTLTRSIQRRLDNTSMEMQDEMYALDRVRLDLSSIITFLKIWLREGNESQVCEWDEHEYTMLLALSILLPPS